MPIPVLFVLGAAAIAALTGTGAGVDAAVKTKKAKNINTEAMAIYEKAEKKAQRSRKKADKTLQKLGETKLHVLDQPIKKYVELFGQIHDIRLKESAATRGEDACSFSEQELNEFEKLSGLASSIIGGAAGGVGAGALIAFGAYGATVAFASASTGTAIASLSGIAASNATLAFLGGGSIAAGGLGVAGGSAVLGGAIAGPAILILGTVMNVSARKRLNKAQINLAEANAAAEGLNTVSVLCKGISKRAKLFIGLLENLERRFEKLLSELEAVLSESGSDYNSYSEDEKETVAMTAAMARAIKTVLDTPILTEEGVVTDESKDVYDEISAQYADEEKADAFSLPVYSEEYCEALTAASYYFAMCDGSIATEEKRLLAQYVDAYLDCPDYSEDFKQRLKMWKSKDCRAIKFTDITLLLDRVSDAELKSIIEFAYKIIYASEGKNADETLAYDTMLNYQKSRTDQD